MASTANAAPAASESDADDEVVFSMPVYLNTASSGTV